MITHNGIWAIKLLGNNDFRFFFFFSSLFFFVANFAFSDNDVRTYLKKKKKKELVVDKLASKLRWNIICLFYMEF